MPHQQSHTMILTCEWCFLKMKEQGGKSVIKEFFAELSSTFPFGRDVNCICRMLMEVRSLS
jgi:hypothetical protein